MEEQTIKQEMIRCQTVELRETKQRSYRINDLIDDQMENFNKDVEMVLQVMMKMEGLKI